MPEAYSLRAAEWADVVEALHGVLNIVTVRSHYPRGHPAITRADDLAYAGLAKMLGRLPEIVVALLDGEFVICERPMPDLKSRLPGLAEVMNRQNVECLVLQRGLTRTECSVLAEVLTAPPDPAPAAARDRVQADLQHVLFRFAEIRKHDLSAGAGVGSEYLVPLVRDLFDRVRRAVASDVDIDRKSVTGVASRVLDRCRTRNYALELFCHGDGAEALAVHATNVAIMTASMALDAEFTDELALDATAAALVHDVGRLLLPADMRDLPEPALGEKARELFRHHPFLGARLLLVSGCPGTWVATALEHHRGVDGAGYPALGSGGTPNEIVRLVSLASFFDSKRTMACGRSSAPEEILQQAWGLADRYFDRTSLRRFTRALGVHPPGTTVELSNREVAVVVRTNPHDPLAPEVRLLTGPSSGKRVDLKTFNAIERRHELAIVRAVAPPLLLPGDLVLAVAAVTAEEKLELKPKTTKPAEERAPKPKAASAPPPNTEMKDLYSLFSDEKSDPLDPALKPVSSRPPSSPRPAATSPPTKPTAPPVVAAATSAAPSPKELKGVYAAIEADPGRPSSGRPPVKAVSKPLVPTARPMSTSGSYSSVSPRPSRPAVGGGASAGSMEGLMARLGPLSRVPRIAVASKTMGGLALDHKAGFVLSLVDGSSSLETILDASGLPQLEVLRVIEDLVARGVLDLPAT
jgi:hypothetical protein